MRRLVISLAVVLLGCPSTSSTGDQSEAAEPEIREYVPPLPETPAKPTSPADEVGVLALLAPVPVAQHPESPNGSIELRYQITGPGGLTGELVVIQKAGGWRSERWTMTGGEGQLAVAGQTIATPRKLWTATGDQPGEITSVQLGALADAWLALTPARRDLALEHLRAWRNDLAKSRLEQPGESETIQGIRCIKMRIAAQNLCMWEEAGLLMRYEGAAFELLVTAVTLNPTIPADAFELPKRAEAAKVIESEAVDAKALIEGLADGKVGPVAALLGSGARMPVLAKSEPEPG
ncbi:hypothetical protein ACNOYE_11495 [Nannocystaceae bacterium ST9]